MALTQITVAPASITRMLSIDMPTSKLAFSFVATGNEGFEGGTIAEVTSTGMFGLPSEIKHNASFTVRLLPTILANRVRPGPVSATLRITKDVITADIPISLDLRGG